MRIEWRVETVYAPDDDVPFLHEYVTKITKAYRPDLTVIPRFEHSDNGIVDMGKGIRILLPAGHWPVSPEVHEPILSEDWHELIYDSVTKRHELKTAELRLERGYNDCSGDSTVHVVSGRNALLFIHGLAPQTEEVPTVSPTKHRIWPDEELSFLFGDTNYKLRGEGVVVEAAMAYIDNGEIERWDDVANYKLYLSEEGREEQLIVALPSFNSVFVTICWIGDLDGDHKPDLLLDISTWYEEKIVVLYLSSLAGEGELVGAAAVSDYYFDC